MMEKFEVERLLRAFGRKSHEHVIESYLEFVKDFDQNEVKKAVDFAIANSEKVPVPAELRRFAAIGRQAEEASCSFCKDKGFVLVGAGNEYDEKGFRYIGHNLPLRCKCGATPPMMNRRWAKRSETKTWQIARLLAHSLSERAAESNMIESQEEWRDFWWNKENIKTWVGLAKRVGGLRELVRLSDLIKGSDPDDCAEAPEKLCNRLLSAARTLTKEDGPVSFFQGVPV